jgi:hypothetical protein
MSIVLPNEEAACFRGFYSFEGPGCAREAAAWRASFLWMMRKAGGRPAARAARACCPCMMCLAGGRRLLPARCFFLPAACPCLPLPDR